MGREVGRALAILKSISIGLSRRTPNSRFFSHQYWSFALVFARSQTPTAGEARSRDLAQMKQDDLVVYADLVSFLM